jgi:hypothetical protein
MEGGTPTEPANSEFDNHERSHLAAEVGPTQSVAPAGEGSAMSVAPDATDDQVVTWEASEYIHHQKAANWYLALAGVTVLICALLFWFIRDWFSIGVVILMAVTVGVYARREPKVQRYSLSRSGLSVGQHHYNLNEFGSYFVTDEGGVQNATFIPLKRFMPPVSVYFLPQDGDKIVSLLGSILPREDRQPDIIDRLMRRIRF